MRLASATLVAALLGTGCSVAVTAPPANIELDKNFSLNVGEVGQLVGDALQVGLEGVTADSRCPKGEQCVWAGDATVRVWLRRGSGPKEVRELHAAPGPAQSARVFDHSLTLVRLDPTAIAGRAIASTAYVATLHLSRQSTAESDR